MDGNNQFNFYIDEIFPTYRFDSQFEISISTYCILPPKHGDGENLNIKETIPLNEH